MRKRFEVQKSLGATAIEDIKIKHTRGSNTAVFGALQWIYSTPEVHEEIFELLESKLLQRFRWNRTNEFELVTMDN